MEIKNKIKKISTILVGLIVIGGASIFAYDKNGELRELKFEKKLEIKIIQADYIINNYTNTQINYSGLQTLKEELEDLLIDFENEDFSNLNISERKNEFKSYLSSARNISKDFRTFLSVLNETEKENLRDEIKNIVKPLIESNKEEEKKLKKDNFISKLKNVSSEYNLSLENDILKYENDEINKSEFHKILKTTFKNLNETERRKIFSQIKKKNIKKKIGSGKNFKFKDKRSHGKSLDKIEEKYNISIKEDFEKLKSGEINKSELKTILEDKFQNLSEDDRKKLLKKIKPKKRFSKKDGKNFDDDKNHDGKKKKFKRENRKNFDKDENHDDERDEDENHNDESYGDK